MTEENHMKVHFMKDLPRDTRVAVCTGKWVQFTTAEREKITCTDCERIMREWEIRKVMSS